MTYGCCAPGFARQYWTREEKIEWLSEYAAELENELKAVKERVEALKRA